MKKTVTIFFLLIFVTTNTTFGQLLRLPTLVHHYLEHVESDNSSFIHFLRVHYASIINHPDDQHGDHQHLPFKALDSQIVQFLMFQPQSVYQISKIVTQSDEIIKFHRNQNLFSNTYLHQIWQPPRVS